MKTRRILALLMAVLMLIGCMAACGSKEEDKKTDDTTGTSTADQVKTDAPAGEPADVVAFDADFINTWGQFVADEEGKDINLTIWAPKAAQDVFKAEAAKFAEMFKDYFNANITVAAQEEGDVKGQVINDPKKAADVFSFPSDQLQELVDAEAITDVIFTDEVTAINTATSVSAATVNGKVYAYPETGDNSYFLAYDKRFVTEEDAKSLESLLAACKAAGKEFTFNSGNGYFTCLYLYTGGIQTLGLMDDGVTQKFNDYDITEATNTVMAFANLFKEYKGTFRSADTTAFADGVKVDPTTVAAGVIGSWDVASVKQVLGDNVGFAILPTINVNGTDKQIINMFGYKYLGVNNYSQFPYAAQLLAYYLSGEECQIDRAQQLEWGPSNINAQNLDVIKNNPSMVAILAQAEYSMPQVGISSTFWSPLEGFGKYVAEPSNSFSFDEVKTQIEACITNIKDE